MFLAHWSSADDDAVSHGIRLQVRLTSTSALNRVVFPTVTVTHRQITATVSRVNILVSYQFIYRGHRDGKRRMAISVIESQRQYVRSMPLLVTTCAYGMYDIL